MHLSPSHRALLWDIPHPGVQEYVARCIARCRPRSVYVSDGSAEARDYIRRRALEAGEEMRLAREGHTAHFDHYCDQARDRQHTRILVTPDQDLGPHIATRDRDQGLAEMEGLLEGIMEGHEMYVCFYTLGPAASPFTIPCLQITDSPYVAHSENILYRPGYTSFLSLEEGRTWLRFLHSQGELDERRTCAHLDRRRVYIDPAEDTVYSVNTQYGGNTIGLKKLAMRLAVRHAVHEGWLTEHMLVMGVHGPGGRVTYFTGAFPSMCGKTSTAMLPGERIIGDDIAHLRVIHGQARAVNVEQGVFGILKDLTARENPVQWEVLHSPGEIIFSNVLVTPDRQVYWLGKGGPEPQQGINHAGPWWKGKRDPQDREIPPAHPNARFTVGLEAFPNLDPRLHDPEGVPVGALVYGGRDADTWVPVQQAFDWEHGIIAKAASLESSRTAAVLEGGTQREFTPMSNLDFLSVSVGDYIQANLDFGRRLTHRPAIFAVNYFLRDRRSGEFLNAMEDKQVWYKWMELRVHGDAGCLTTPTGCIPRYADLRLLFRKTLGKRYLRSHYRRQFTIRVPENLAKIQRITAIYREQVRNAPPQVFRVLEEEGERLELAQRRHGDYIPPERFA
ncbi:MAG: phosphoenolpyruvate carboxykinase (GTP) [Thermoplasmatota archaeon]